MITCLEDHAKIEKNLNDQAKVKGCKNETTPSLLEAPYHTKSCWNLPGVLDLSWTLSRWVSSSSVPEINEGVTRLWLKIIIYVFIKDCTDPQRCSENNIKHHLAWRKNMLPSNKQKLIRFRTIEWVGKAQWNNRKLCLISISHICPWYQKKMSLCKRVTIEWPIVALRSILASKTSHTKRFLSSKREFLKMNSESN